MSVIDEYLVGIDPDQRAALERVRTIAKTVVPDADETIGYGMPVLKYNKKYLIGFSAFKNHMSIFPGSEAIATMQSQLKDFKTAKGTIQFTLENPLPEKLIKEIVTDCLKNITKK